MVIKKLDSKSFDSFIKKGNAVVDFYADWCNPCKIMKPHFEKAAEKIKNVHFGKVDVEENQNLAKKFGVMSIPTTIFFKNGEQVDRHTGALDFDELNERLKRHLNNSNNY